MTSLLAQTETAAAPSLLPFVLIMGLFLVFMNVMQRRRVKKQQSFQDSIEVGDRVQTIGGIQGRILSADDTSVLLEVETGRIRFARKAIAAKLTESS